eukprot:TRINITY_DN8219_c0_g1_i1.p1 TRINITY_DN8219_c0_g1~~TRINITY_DN8219_c0_g1_i1.p1  ORF type:complete len:378 (+),score=62.66 TRINITY_DN8219_c0_g1_i1:137-1270(+)
MGNKSSSSSSSSKGHPQYTLTNAPESSQEHDVPSGFYRIHTSALSSLHRNVASKKKPLLDVKVLLFAMCSYQDARASGDIGCLTYNLFDSTNAFSQLLRGSIRDAGLDLVSDLFCRHYSLEEDVSSYERTRELNNQTSKPYTCSVNVFTGHAWRWLGGSGYIQGLIARYIQDQSSKPLKKPVVLLFVYADSRDCDKNTDFAFDTYPSESFVKYVQDEMNLAHEWIPSIVVHMDGRREYPKDSQPFDLRGWCKARELPYFIVDLASKESFRTTKKALERFALAAALGWYQQRMRGLKRSDLQHKNTLVDLTMRTLFEHPEIYPQDQLKGVMPEDLYQIYDKRYSVMYLQRRVNSVSTTSSSPSIPSNKKQKKREKSKN